MSIIFSWQISSSSGGNFKLFRSLNVRSQQSSAVQVLKNSNPAPRIRLSNPTGSSISKTSSSDEFYEPETGDIVVGVIVSGNASVLDINIGARLPGMMFSRDMTPFDKLEVEDRMWDLDSAEQQPPSIGRACIVRDEEILTKQQSDDELILEAGTVLQLVVMGKTLSGKALLSIRNLVRPIAWERVREVHNTEGVIEVCIESYNPGGLICRIEGLTAFLPKDMIQNSPRDLTSLKAYVGKHLFVLIVEVDEAKPRIIVNERAAWVQQLAPPDSLVEGVVVKVHGYGVIVKIDGTELSALLHVSSISHRRIPSVAEIFSEGDRVKAVVMRPRVPDKVILSTAVLEQEKGSIVTDKERVFRQAEEAYKAWKLDKGKYVDGIRRSNNICYEELKDAETKKTANMNWLQFLDD